MLKALMYATLAVLAAASPAMAAMEDLGRGNLTVGFQSVGARGLNLAVDGAVDLGVMELGARLMAPPGGITSFFTADAGATFVGHTGRFLPVDLQPMMGIAFSFLMQDLPGTSGGSTTTDLNMDMYMPVGLRYAFNMGGFGLQAQALYHLTAIQGGKADLGHWRFEVGGRSGGLFAAGFYEMGAVYNGPGARIGLAF